MATLGHYGDYDEYLRMLVEAMRYKLRVNSHKGHLGDVPLEQLLAKIREEITELEDAAQRGSKIEMILEAADLANFALGFIIAALKPAVGDTTNVRAPVSRVVLRSKVVGSQNDTPSKRSGA
jgi:phosphoribosyl-ATP pyrophosphohydrolase